MFCMSTFFFLNETWGHLREKDFYQVKIIFTKEPHKRSQRKMATQLTRTVLVWTKFHNVF